MKIKDKIKILFIIIFLILFILPIFLNFIGYKNEAFIGDNIGQWKLLLRQTHGSPYKFIKGKSVNENTLSESDYFDKKINPLDYTIKYKISDTANVDIQYYKLLTYDKDNVIKLNFEWRQNNIIDETVNDFSSTSNLTFTGLLIDNIKSMYLGKYNSNTTSGDPVDGSFNIGVFDIKDTDGLDIMGNKYNRVEIFIWDPRPDNIIENKNSKYKINKNNTLDFYTIEPIKVNMSNIEYYDRVDKSVIKAEDESYSYCFGKVLCSDPSYNLKYDNNIIQPYCDEKKNIPVYCSGSGLYSSDDTPSQVQYKDLYSSSKNITFELIGEPFKQDIVFDGNNVYNNQINSFRGLTKPFKEVKDKRLTYNEKNKIVTVNDKNNNFIEQHICEFLDNKKGGYDLNPSTTIKDECYKANNIEDFKDGYGYNEKKCIANYGEPLHDSKYIDYVCQKNEACFDYVCGKKFGTCKKIYN